MNRKVVVAGHICLDITPMFPAIYNKRIEEVLLPGKIIQTNGVNVSTGGAVANTGLAMKKLGAEVCLMGKVGNDAFGDLICSILDKYGSSDSMIRSEGEQTSYSVVISIPGNDRFFLHFPGCNDTFCSSDFPAYSLTDASLFHFGYPTIMKSMYINDGKELVDLFSFASNSGCATSLDLSSIDPDSEAAKADWKLILSRVIPFVDFFVPSIEELCFMLDRNRYYSWLERANSLDIAETLDFENDIKPIADMCMEMGCKVLLLKCGVKGLFLRTAGISITKKISDRICLDLSNWSDISILEKPYKPDKILSATGAGDTSIAAFLTAILDGYSPKESIQFASATGAACLTSYDALSGLMSFDDIKSKISLGWRKLGE